MSRTRTHYLNPPKYGNYKLILPPNLTLTWIRNLIPRHSLLFELFFFLFQLEGWVVRLENIKSYKSKKTSFHTVTQDKHVQVCLTRMNSQNKYELTALQKSKNIPGLVQYIGHFTVNENLYLVEQFNPHAITFHQFVTDKNGLSETEIHVILTQLINTLLWCQTHGILHNDVNYQSILINPANLNIVLNNFGASQPWYSDKLYTTYKGSLFNGCPEYITHGKYTAQEMTTWSLGVLMFFMLTGNHAFQTITDTLFVDPDTERLLISNEAQHFLHQCLDRNPTTRIKLEHMLDHPWFK